MKELSANKINVTEKLKFVLERVENIKGKGKNASYQDSKDNKINVTVKLKFEG